MGSLLLKMDPTATWAPLRITNAFGVSVSVSAAIVTPASRTQGRFPSIYDPASVLVSVIVPAYNEEKRMTPMMDEMLGFLREEQKKDK